MYAVFRTGGKQYRAAKGDVLRLEKIEADEGGSVVEICVANGEPISTGDILFKIS